MNADGSRSKRLADEANLWLATVHPSGAPQLTPVWFTWVDERLWVCTTANAVKVRNIAANNAVSFALEDGNAPVTGSGHATLHDSPFAAAVVKAFVHKYEWDIGTDEPPPVLIEIIVTRWVHPGGEVVG